MKKHSKLLALILALSISLVPVAGAVDATISTQEETSVVVAKSYDQMTPSEKFDYLLGQYSTLHLDKKTKEELLTQAFKALIESNPEQFDEIAELLVSSNDPHNHYLNKAEFDSVFNAHQKFGIGVKAFLDGDKVCVSTLYEGSAKAANIKEGDQIIAVNGKSVLGKNVAEVGALIAGEENTTVSITVSRNSELNPITVSLNRGGIYIDSITYQVLRKNVGYIKIEDFTDELGIYEFYDALKHFRSLGINDLVIDVRDNTGGYLYSALSMVNMLTSKADILMATTHATEGDDRYLTSGDGFTFDKIAVLVNGTSASSAEIFAGIIKDLNLGILVGTQTYGKARGQNYYPFGADHFLGITTSDIALPVTGYYHDIGITPNKIVENALANPMTTNIYNFDYTLGNTPRNVQAAKQKLYTLDFFYSSADTVYNDAIKKSITIFQNRNNLTETGVLDEVTMYAIDDALLAYANSLVLEDLQLQSALIYAKS